MNAFLAFRWQRGEQTVRQARRVTAFVMDSVGATLSFPRPPDELATRDSLYWVWVATLARLMRQGLADPPNQLRDSLAAQRDLIPYPGVLSAGA